MKFIYLFLFLFTITSACAKISVPKGTPYAIKKLIRKEQKHCLSKVYNYNFEGQKYYYFQNGHGGCADSFNDLYNEKGELLCHPDGGISGGGDGKCGDYYIGINNALLIWENK